MRISVLKRMIEAGLGDRILLGNDLGRPSYWRSYGGGPGLDYVLTRFVPRLRDEGVSDGRDPGPAGRQPAAFPDGRVIKADEGRTLHRKPV